MILKIGMTSSYKKKKNKKIVEHEIMSLLITNVFKLGQTGFTTL